MKIIETKELTKYYGPIKGIEKLNLTINKGEIYGFIGPNGAGKSTTIRTLLNYIFQTSGSAKIFNKDIIEDTVEIRKNIGYISAEVNFYEDLTCLELLKHSKVFIKM